MERKITVSISPLGASKIEAHNFSGGACTDATKAIETALAGSGGVDRVIKPEWYEAEDTSQREQEFQQW